MESFSSPNDTRSPSWLIVELSSLMYSENNNGNRIYPYLTPALVLNDDPHLLSITTEQMVLL